MTEQTATRILKLSEVLKRTGMSRSSLYSWMKQGLFPEQVSLGPRSVGWVESEVEAWLQERIRLRNKNN